MSTTKYLVDNNALGTLGNDRRESSFFREHCRVPAEVAYEARHVAYAKTLEPFTIEMTPDMLKKLVDVMKTVPAGSTKLIDLYDNKGAADPILVAMALVLNDPIQPSLFRDDWVIVTNDKEVTAKAEEFSIGTLTPKELADAIDAAPAAARKSQPSTRPTSSAASIKN